MDINSILEQILSNGTTSSKGNIELNDNSHLWNLIHRSPNDESSRGEEFKIGESIRDRYQDSRKRRFSVTYFIYSIFIYIAKLIVCGFYKIASFLRSLLTGKPCNLSQSPRFNFIVFVAACILYIMMIVAILIFFVKSVLLFKPDTRVNDYGAIAMPQSCERENYMFLLNTASLWDNSGIKVIKGDDVRITVSGSFFSDIDEMYNSALYNKMPKYGRTYVTFDNSRKQDPDTSIHSYFLLTNVKDIKKVKDFNKPYPAKKTDPTFGSLLVAIRDASQSRPFYKESIITQIDPNAKVLAFTADRSGYLNFAVNDEYIDTASFTIIQKSINLQKKLGINNIANIQESKFDSIKTSIRDSINNSMDISKKSGYTLLNSLDSLKSDTIGDYFFFTVAGLETAKRNESFQNCPISKKDSLHSLTKLFTREKDKILEWYTSQNLNNLSKSRIDSLFHPYRAINYLFFHEKSLNSIKNNTELQNALKMKDDVKSLITWKNWNEGIARMWYSDNVGDILINVNITRNTVQGNVFEPGILTKSYRRIENFFLAPYFWQNNLKTLILIAIAIFLWLVLDYCHGRSFLDYVKEQYKNLHDFIANRKNISKG